MAVYIDTQIAQPKRSSKNDLFSVNFKAVTPHVRTTPESSPTISNRSSWQSSDSRPNRWLARSPSRSTRSASFSTEEARSPSALKAADLPTELVDFVIPQDIDALHSEPFNFRLCPSRSFLLGIGRHSSVYLASYRDAPAKWRLCAAKRVDRDKEAYADALREAYIMSRLSSNEAISNNHIVRLIGIRQETEAEEWYPEAESEGHSRRSSTANSIRSIGLGLSNSSGYNSTNQLDTTATTSQIEDVAISRLRNSSSMHSIPTLGRPKSVDIDSHRRTTSLREPPSSKSSILEPHTPEPRIVMLMELCAKGTTAALIRRQPHLVTRSLWLKWAKQMSIALSHCHRLGILHADVKSQNIMLSDTLDAHLSDFGMSLYLSHASPADGLGLGTTVYNAPELVQASPQPFGFSADVYAFGVTLNVLLTGHEPFFNCRSPVEQMLWASRGGYWEWETRRKLAECGNDSPSVSSLRMSQRNWSIDSLDSASFVRASPSVGAGHRGPSARAVAGLLTDEEGEALAVCTPVSSLAAEDDSDEDVPPIPVVAQRNGSSTLKSYSDGSPIQYFLSGKDPVPEGILKLIERMTAREPSARPLMREVVNALQVF